MKSKKRLFNVYKIIMDRIIALILLIVLFPILIMLSIWIKLDSKGPIFFVQKRIGKDQKTFEMIKFRTMKIDTPKNTPTHQLKNPDQWLTRIGKILRRTSLDELPQLINIIRGEMSFIGPRPALWNQDDLISEREKYNAHSVKPGITGYAQVYGRDTLEIPEKAKLDGYYIDHYSMKLDLKILIRTILVVLKSDGVIEGGTGALDPNHKDNKK